jgi:hypothetical protein
MRYLSSAEYNTLVAAIRCYQGVLETGRHIGRTLFDCNALTQEWINDLQEIATDAAPDQTGNLDEQYLEMLVDRLSHFRVPETPTHIAEPDHLRLKREHINQVVLEKIQPGALLLVSHLHGLIHLPATVLSIDRASNSSIKIHYTTVTDGESIDLMRDKDGMYTSVFIHDLRPIAYIGVAHPNPELESWAIFNVEDERFVNQAENGAVPALTYEELEEQMLELSEDLNPTLDIFKPRDEDFLAAT